MKLEAEKLRQQALGGSRPGNFCYYYHYLLLLISYMYIYIYIRLPKPETLNPLNSRKRAEDRIDQARASQIVFKFLNLF